MVEEVDYFRINPDHNNGKKYQLLAGQYYWSRRYKKSCSGRIGFRWDGATGAKDLVGSRSHLFHDILCNRKTWDDGTKLSNWKRSQVLKDILKEEGYKFRQYTWRWATFLFGEIKRRPITGWFRKGVK
jgi:hypothetical protein